MFKKSDVGFRRLKQAALLFILPIAVMALIYVLDIAVWEGVSYGFPLFQLIHGIPIVVLVVNVFAIFTLLYVLRIFYRKP